MWAQLSNESSDSISHRNNGRKQLSQIFKLGQWKFYSTWAAMSGKPRNVGVYCVHREIKFLIEPLRRIQACHFWSVAEIARPICFKTLLDRDESCVQNLFVQKLSKFTSIMHIKNFFIKKYECVIIATINIWSLIAITIKTIKFKVTIKKGTSTYMST